MGPATRFVPAGLLGLALLAGAAFADPLDDAKARLKIEAERLERDFAELRSAAYRLVRSDSPRLADALDKIDQMVRLLRDDAALDAARRATLQATIKYDLEKVREIASDRKRTSSRPLPPPVRETGRPGSGRAVAERSATTDIERMIAARKKTLADGRAASLDKAEARTRIGKSIEDASVPETSTVKFHPDWKKMSERRMGIKMTAQEKAIMAGLDKMLKVDFEKAQFQDTLDYLRKATGLPITVDKKAMEQAGASYDTPVTLKTETSVRSILKRLAADLDLVYVIKDESILLTSRAVADKMTVTRTYYLGDLVGFVNPGLDPITSQLVMLERVNGLIQMITNKFDRDTWNVNNPDSPGAITFHPATMTLIVKQKAEFHFKYFGGR